MRGRACRVAAGTVPEVRPSGRQAPRPPRSAPPPRLWSPSQRQATALASNHQIAHGVRSTLNLRNRWDSRLLSHKLLACDGLKLSSAERLDAPIRVSISRSTDRRADQRYRGVSATSAQIAAAIAILRTANGTAVRQPLLKHNNPLAYMDYHAVAAKFRMAHPDAAITKGDKRRHTAHVKAAVQNYLTERLSEFGEATPQSPELQQRKKRRRQGSHADRIRP